jgi:gliding motility-associated-like protein
MLVMMQSLTAQVVMDGRNIINQVECNHTRLGSIELNVKQTNPPYSYSWNSGQTTPQITDLEPGEYIVKIVDSKGADTTLHFKIIQLECEMTPEIFFTPNEDGYNDTWGISYALHFSNSLVVVYNKLGQKVYEFTGRYEHDDEWDGTDLLGKPLPMGTYYFIVYSDKSDKNKYRKGTLSIIR